MAEPGVPSPTAPGSTPQVASAQQSNRLMHYWSVRLPGLLDRWAPHLADSLADGAWLAGWRFSGVAPFFALAVGFLMPWLWPGMKNIYSESLVFLAFAITVSIMSGTWGATLLLGYVLGDFLATLHY